MKNLLLIVLLTIFINGCNADNLPENGMVLYTSGIIANITSDGVLITIDTQKFFIETDKTYSENATVFIKMIVVYDIDIDALVIVDTIIIN